MSMSITTKQAHAAITMAGAIAEAVREAGSIPAGHVYAVLCGSMSASTFDQLVATLGRAGLVSREGDLLKWVGPVLA
jgi:hypothetical protein